MLIACRAKWWSYNTKVGTKNHTWDEIKDLRHGMMCNSIMLWWEWGGWSYEKKKKKILKKKKMFKKKIKLKKKKICKGKKRIIL